jgi:putative ABC transport system permease protein
MLWITIAVAFQEIRRHVLRSFLTVLGIVIGVWSVVTMVTLGNATTIAVSESISSLGSNTLTLMPGRGFGRGGGSLAPPPFHFTDVNAILTQVSGVTHAVPEVTVSKTVIMNAENWQTTVTGTTGAYLDVQQWKLADGRRFTPEEEEGGKSVCLLGDTVRSKLSNGVSPVGEVMRVGNSSCTIIGTLSPKGQGFGSNPDDSVLMPVRAVQRNMAGSQDINQVVVSYDPKFDVAGVKSDLTALMRQRRLLAPGTENNFNIFDARQIADTVSGTTRLMTALLAAVGAVSLVVGGIGIMNIMLVSVTERTREIGTRLAVGAVSGDVLLQFLVEAVVLSSLGGLVGLVLANLTTLLVSPVLGVKFTVYPMINILAVALSAAIGVGFGYVPARRAAALRPIEALRYE